MISGHPRHWQRHRKSRIPCVVDHQSPPALLTQVWNIGGSCGRRVSTQTLTLPALQDCVRGGDVNSGDRGTCVWFMCRWEPTEKPWSQSRRSSSRVEVLMVRYGPLAEIEGGTVYYKLIGTFLASCDIDDSKHELIMSATRTDVLVYQDEGLI